jgi:amphi-Trp domain-containing protein
MSDRNTTAQAPSTETERVIEAQRAPPVTLVPEDDERSRDKIKFKQTLGREEVAAYLDAIVRGLRKGQIEFRHRDEALALNLAPSLQLSVKASEKSKGGKLNIELAWSDSARVSLEVSS